MPPPQFRVLLSEDVKEQLRAAIALANTRGQKNEALRAVRAIAEGLKWFADELGESRFPLRLMGELRVVVIGPIGAVFAVNRTKLEVNVGRFRLLGVRRSGQTNP
jgi:hypothetical protein